MKEFAMLMAWLVASGLIMFVSFRIDRVVAFLLTPWQRRLFPEAHAIASSLRDDLAEWDFSVDHCTHRPTGLCLCSYGNAHGVRIRTRLGTWEPDFVSRRIIQNALDYKSRGLVRDLAPSYFSGEGAQQRLAITADRSGIVWDPEQADRKPPS